MERIRRALRRQLPTAPTNPDAVKDNGRGGESGAAERASRQLQEYAAASNDPGLECWTQGGRMRAGIIIAGLVLGAAGLGWHRTVARQGQNGGQEGGFRSQVDLVSVYFTVRDDKKRLVDDLAQASFRVTEDGQPQTVRFFAHHSDVVLNVGVLLDTGTHMSSILDEEGHASSMFLRHVVRPTDLGFVVSYAGAVNTLQL